MKHWVRGFVSMVLAIFGSGLSGRATSTHILAFFHPVSACVAPKSRSMVQQQPRTCRGSLLASRNFLLKNAESEARRPLISCTLALRGGDWKNDEGVVRNVSSAREFHDVFENLRTEMESSSRMGEEEWQHLQARMANTAREFVEWCRTWPETTSDGARGILVVLEGLDKSGKSTQVELLRQSMQDSGRDVRRVQFPDRSTPLGKMIDMFLKSGRAVDDRALHLLFSANRWEAAAEMRTNLQNGQILILDRYAFSGIAYSTAKGVDKTWCMDQERGLPAPDLVIFMDIDPEVAALRSTYGEERFEKLGFQKEVRRRFQDLREDSWLWVDAIGEKSKITRMLLDAVEKRLRESSQRPLASLWQTRTPS